ncbi:MAG: DUF4038 domain-containing protein [Verrucomicrobiales bacterium]|nr:DUF4038 domain-containing protein [Verrucomicrobiales bacterium]
MMHAALLLCLVLAGVHRSALAQVESAISQSAELTERAPAPAWERREIEGWIVPIRPALIEGTEAQVTERALTLLRQQLKEILRVVPASAAKELQRVPLFFSPPYPGRQPTAEYHPDAGWLRANGRDVAMAKAVEFSNVRQFEAEMNRMPNFTLHELAHAYHDRVLPQGFANAEIKAAYERARTNGTYDRVERWFGNGRPNSFERAYAMTDPMEYFAETSEAFFSRNDFFPFRHDELKTHDPVMFALVARLWGATTPIARVAGSEARSTAATSDGLMADSLVPRLRVGDNRRFLVTEDGNPFFWLGDTAWELFHRLDRTEAELYLADRAAKGFTVIQAVALAELDGLSEPNRQGDRPLVDDDPSRPSVKPGPANDYWDFVDEVIDLAATKGLRIGFLPTWGKYVTSSPFDGKVDGIFNVTNAVAYGRFLGQRYRDRSNLIWILGGDKAPSTPGAVAVWRALARGITEGVAGGNDDAVLMTYHTAGPGHVSDYLHDEPWLDFTSVQSSHGDLVESWRFIEKHWDRQPVKPVIDLESSYPDALILAAWLPESLRALHKSTRPSNDDHARRAAYWAVFAGAAGHTYGHNSIWQMYAPPRKPILSARLTWKEALDAPSARQMGLLRSLMESRPFLSQAPDQALIASPVGEGTDHLRALRGDGYALIYTPVGQPFRVHLDRFTGREVKAGWFDPRTGQVTAAGQFANDGSREFAPPGPPGAGRDWVLVLEDPQLDFRPTRAPFRQ